MKDIPENDLLRAELQELRRDFAKCDAARIELSRAHDSSKESVVLLTELVATLVHRSGVAGAVVTDEERRAAWEACWLRVSIDFLEDEDDGSSSMRVSLMPPDAVERADNAAAVGKAAAERAAAADK